MVELEIKKTSMKNSRLDVAFKSEKSGRNPGRFRMWEKA